MIYLGSRIKYLPDGEQLFSNLLNAEEEHPLVKILAAWMQVQHEKEQTSRETVRFLLDVLVHPDPSEEMYITLPWQFRNNLVSDISNLLPLLGYDIAALAIPALLERLQYLEQRYQLRISNHEKGADGEINLRYTRTRQDYAIPYIIQALFYFAFQEKRLQANAVPFLLTTTQRAILTTILTSDIAENFSDVIVESLDKLGLPYRWKLKILLQLN